MPKCLTFNTRNSPPYFRRRRASGHVILDRAFSVRWEIQPDVTSHHCSDRVLATNFKLILILCEDSHKIEVFFVDFFVLRHW